MTRSADPNSVRSIVRSLYKSGTVNVRDIVNDLESRGIRIKVPYCSSIVSQLRSEKKVRGTVKMHRPAQQNIQVPDLIKSLRLVADFVKEAGGIKEAKNVLEALEALQKS